MSNERVLHGPRWDHLLPKGTVGQEIYARLSSADPEKIAMLDVFTTEQLSYGQLFEQSCMLAEALRTFNYVGQDTVLSLSSENSVHFYIPIIASLYNCSVMAPLNNTYSPMELEHVLGITQPRVMFCSETVVGKFLTLKKKVNFIEKIVLIGSSKTIPGTERLQDFIDRGSGRSFDISKFRPLDGDAKSLAAYALCSSGTTGMPKAVLLSQWNIMIRITHARDPLNKIFLGDSMIGLLPFFHGYGISMGLEALLENMTVLVMNRFEEDAYFKCIQDHKVRHLMVVPFIMVILATTPKLEKYDVSSVRRILTGGAALDRETMTAVKKRFKNLQLWQGYGLTEATVGVMYNGNDTKTDSCGRLFSSMSCCVQDPETRKHLGPNEAGEICLKGPLLMMGYYKNEEATRDSFTADGWLKSGDLGYYDNDGFFYIIGRLKELIKYKGFQVAPAELEALLLKHPKIEDAAVVGVPDKLVGERPLAFVIKKEGAEVTSDEIIKYIADLVSPHKRLSGGVIFVTSIPKTAIGKIQRNKLKALLKASKHQNILKSKM